MIKCIAVEDTLEFGGAYMGVKVVQDERTAEVTAGDVLIVCSDVLVSRFGYPNDEALPGDPLYDCGLQLEYGRCFEFLDSPWLEEIKRRNKIPFSDSEINDFRHFYMPFRDSSFEVLCRAIEFIGPLNFWARLARKLGVRIKR